MLFSIIKDGEAFEGRLLFLTSDHSFFYQLLNPVKNDVSIICGLYTSLNINSQTGRACTFDGLSSKEAWIKTKLNYPVADAGRLYVHFSEIPFPGVGLNYNDGWLVYADESSRCVCVGNDTTISSDDQLIEFAKGEIAVISRAGALKSIWAQYEENTDLAEQNLQ